MKKAEQLRKKVLENHKEWLEAISENIEDYPNSLDIADSANEVDFKETMFNNCGFDYEWTSSEQVNLDGVELIVEFNYTGLEVFVLKNDDVNGDEDWFVALENEYCFSIPWAEFDSQMMEYK